MADGWTHSVICRYFKNGVCREGNNCRYRHVQGNRNDTNINNVETMPNGLPSFNVTCRFFKQGVCKFGSQCHFRHNTNILDTNVTQINAIENPTSGHNASSSKNKKDDKRTAEEWVKAPEFIPTVVPPIAGSSSSTNEMSISGTSTSTSMPISYAQAVNPSGQASNPCLEPLCPYAEATGICKKLNCTYLHGDICELCNRAALHPHNEELRKKHTNACVKQHEADMELSFAIQRSKEKSCGVCFETIMEKSSREQRFGILPNCNHCFCLTCIRKWRQAKQFDNKIIRACPECRVPSDFVCPSMYWVDTKEEKEKLIRDYKGALSTKDCKYFNKGRGKCPFGNKCFYLHALPDGTKKDVGPPVRQRRNADSDMDILHRSSGLCSDENTFNCKSKFPRFGPKNREVQRESERLTRTDETAHGVAAFLRDTLGESDLSNWRHLVARACTYGPHANDTRACHFAKERNKNHHPTVHRDSRDRADCATADLTSRGLRYAVGVC